MKIHIPLWLTLIVILETLPMFIGPYVAITNPGFMGGLKQRASIRQPLSIRHGTLPLILPSSSPSPSKMGQCSLF